MLSDRFEDDPAPPTLGQFTAQSRAARASNPGERGAFMPPSRPLLERFEEKYTPEPMSGCWLWTAATTVDGYGEIRSGGKTAKAHRVAWTLFRYEIPPGIEVCHRCDNPPCVNPAHLFLGTRGDNMGDCAKKGRAWNPTAEMEKNRTHCHAGHEYTESNTYWRPDCNNSRGCRKCRAATERRRRAAARTSQIPD